MNLASNIESPTLNKQEEEKINHLLEMVEMQQLKNQKFLSSIERAQTEEEMNRQKT